MVTMHWFPIVAFMTFLAVLAFGAGEIYGERDRPILLGFSCDRIMNNPATGQKYAHEINSYYDVWIQQPDGHGFGIVMERPLPGWAVRTGR